MKDRKIYCLNNIAKVGTDHFRAGYELADSMDDAAGVLVRSADMKEMEFPKDLRAIARAGAGVNNIPIDRCTESGIVVFNTPGREEHRRHRPGRDRRAGSQRGPVPGHEGLRF